MAHISISSYRSEKLIADHSYFDLPNSFPPHIHDAYELLFLTKGEATYTVEGKSYLLKKGSLVITFPLKVHAVTFHTPSEYERYDIVFDASILSSDIISMIPAKTDVIHSAGNTMIPDLCKQMDYYCDLLTGQLQNVLLTHLCEEILINAHITLQAEQERSTYTTNALVNDAIKFIEQHLAEPLTVEDTCKELHISQSYLLSLFRQHLNISPKQYIMTKRLTMAQMALRSGAKPTEVYRQCGFSDYSTFFRAYKNQFGHPPSMETDLMAIRSIDS